DPAPHVAGRTADRALVGVAPDDAACLRDELLAAHEDAAPREARAGRGELDAGDVVAGQVRAGRGRRDDRVAAEEEAGVGRRDEGRAQAGSRRTAFHAAERLESKGGATKGVRHRAAPVSTGAAFRRALGSISKPSRRVAGASFRPARPEAMNDHYT